MNPVQENASALSLSHIVLVDFNRRVNDAHERVYSPEDAVEKVPLGLYVIRGDNLCVVAEYDESKWPDDTTAPEPLPPIQQHQF